MMNINFLQFCFVCFFELTATQIALFRGHVPFFGSQSTLHFLQKLIIIRLEVLNFGNMKAFSVNSEWLYFVHVTIPAKFSANFALLNLKFQNTKNFKGAVNTRMHGYVTFPHPWPVTNMGSNGGIVTI